MDTTISPVDIVRYIFVPISKYKEDWASKSSQNGHDLISLNVRVIIRAQYVSCHNNCIILILLHGAE